jgi:4'-phosphopantetheinyl transferase
VLCDPARIQYSRNEYGKPVLLCAQSAERVSFNVSHSGGLALVAVAAGQEVGVDIERIDPRIEIMNVASVIFSPGEVSVLARIPEPLRRDAFFSCWTRKEAYIKAKGMGLSMPLNQFDVSLAPTEPAALLATRDDPDEAARWSLFELPIDPGFAATLAIGRKISELRLFQWDVQSM